MLYIGAGTSADAVVIPAEPRYGETEHFHPHPPRAEQQYTGEPT
jgi:hypothetical protein